MSSNSVKLDMAETFQVSSFIAQKPLHIHWEGEKVLLPYHLEQKQTKNWNKYTLSYRENIILPFKRTRIVEDDRYIMDSDHLSQLILRLKGIAVIAFITELSFEKGHEFFRWQTRRND